MNKINYTLETVPEDIGINQFYCYNTKNGAINIGRILGKSTKSTYMLYDVNGTIYTTIAGFNENYRTMSLDRKLKCFLDYQTFVNSYTEYLAKKEKEKAKKKRKTQYVVDKKTFYCKKTSAILSPHLYEEFASKEEAEKFAYRGLEKLKSSLPKLIKEYRELRLILADDIIRLKKEFNIKSETIFLPHLYDVQERPRTIKENDILFKVDTKKYGETIYVNEIVDGSTVSVKGFINPCLAKLSNGEILIEGECNYAPPFMFQYADKDKIAILVKIRNTKYFLEIIEADVKTLEAAQKYVFSYVPFDDKLLPPYFDISYKQKSLKDIKDYLKTLEEKENEQDI